MKPVADSKELMKGAMILTLAALVTKILSAVYRVPFQNIVGDIGFYIYQQVYPFFGIVMVLSTYGFPVIISKLYTEEQAAGNPGRADRLLAISLVFLGMVGVLLFTFFFFCASWISGKIGDPELKPLFKVVSFPFLLFPFISVFRGYFQGKGNMVPTAISQVSEQFIRVATILVLSSFLVQQGFSLYAAGAGAVSGSITGGLVSVLLLGFYFLKNKGGDPFRHFQTKDLFRDAGWAVKALVIQGFAISISGMLLILFQLADSLNMYISLLDTGLTAEEAKTAKGIFDRGQPLIQLGTVVATSMSLSLVPAISGDKSSSDRQERILAKVRLALQTSLVFGAAAAVGLSGIMVPVNIMLFENANGSSVLAVLSLMILFASVILTIMSILQGLDHPLFPAAVVLAGFGVKYILNLILIPPYGTMGAASATLIAMLGVMMVLIAKLRRELGGPVLSLVFIGKILLSSAVMAVFLRLFLFITDFGYGYIEPDRLGAIFQALSSVAIGAFVYFFVLIKTRALTEDELATLPFGSRIVQLFSR
ncbi:putative polysaccharide biosynthesis protein [Mesobacillus thioparans]|uniref:putative polysaccharide biosynthesis protein n=1 Tax=Mesobacillus thioparans TaxID=370439 RepID=UPI0039F0CD65